MSVDPARVVQVYAEGQQDSQTGSGYAVSERIVLTAAHVLANAGLEKGDRVQVALLSAAQWVWSSVVIVKPDVDLALLEVDKAEPWDLSRAGLVRWGAVAASKPVPVAAVGFPWSMEKPSGLLDTEHVVGFVTPLAGLRTGMLQVSVTSAAPRTTEHSHSPWAGLSGSALLAGPFLIGVVVIDPGKFGTDRLVAAPIEQIMSDLTDVARLQIRPSVTPVGEKWRLTYAQGRSVALRPPYELLPLGFQLKHSLGEVLKAQYGLVPFWDEGRIVVNELIAWARSEMNPGLRVRLLTGQGGTGKTRASAEACLALARFGWDAGFADSSSPQDANEWSLERPTFLVLDEAHQNFKTAVELIAFLMRNDVPSRLLLVARSREPWWPELEVRTQFAIAGLFDGELTTQRRPDAESARVAHYEAAYRAFRSQPLFSAESVETSRYPAESEHGQSGESHNHEWPGLESPIFESPLQIQVAALLAAVGEGPSAGRTFGSGPVAQVLLHQFLELEAHRWMTDIGALESGELASLDKEIVRRSVAISTISTPQNLDEDDNEDEGATLLTAIPDIESNSGKRRVLTRWLHTRSPGPDYWNPLVPTPIADQLLANLTGLPRISEKVLEYSLTHRRLVMVNRLLSQLTRASLASSGTAESALKRVLSNRLRELLELSVANASSNLPQNLRAALSACPVPTTAREVLTVLPEDIRLPFQLTHLAVTVIEQAVTVLRQEASDRDELAEALRQYGGRLAAAAQYSDALAAITESRDLYTELGHASPSKYAGRVAEITVLHAAALRETGNLTEAVVESETGLHLYRAQKNAQHDLAGALVEHANLMGAMGRQEDALDSVNEAITLLRDVQSEDLAMIAGALNNRSNALSHLEQYELARVDIEDAVKAFRTLSASDPDVFRPDLALVLNNRSSRLHSVGEYEKALESSEESVEIFRELTDVHPEVWTSELLAASVTKANRLRNLDRQLEALAILDDVVKATEQLARGGLPARRMDYAIALRNQAQVLRILHRLEDAASARQTEISVYRDLAQRESSVYLDHLAGGLIKLGELLRDLGRFQDALASDVEAEGIYVQLAVEEPSQFGYALRNARLNIETDKALA